MYKACRTEASDPLWRRLLVKIAALPSCVICLGAGTRVVLDSLFRDDSLTHITIQVTQL